MDLSVIIVSFNTKELVEQCLNSVFKFTKGIKFEVIVVDNASTDGSIELVKKKFPQVKLILNDLNLGFSKANNRGIKKAKGKFIFLLNSDTYLLENSFYKLLNNVRSRSMLGVIAPQLLNVDRSFQQSAGYFPHLPQIFYWMSFLDDLPGGAHLKPYHIDHDSFYREGHEVDWVTGAALLISKKAINSAGLLDQRIFMYGEDVEWCFRIKKAGFKIYFSPITQIVHIGRGSDQKIPMRALIGEYKGLIYFYKKHKSKIALQILKVFLKIGALVRITVFGVLGRKELSKYYVEAFKVS